MGWNKILVISLISCCFISCLNYYHTKNGSVRPKKNKFEFGRSPYKLKKEDLIDTNSIYIYNHESTSITKGKYFIRFFSNGRCIEGTSELYSGKLNLDRMNDFYNSGVLVGYYKIENFNEITIETYSVKKHEGGYYKKTYGIIKNDSLYITDEKKNLDLISLNKKHNIVYQKNKIKGLTGTPNW
ncbi:hypothetical protein [Tenacibaculum ovolyticum]|uniref:hypothetical protein n=1 Tax=Tenacibaculum ovolyticum TaxID=104270 RepID=UPI001F3514AE|nr:hypothetical protein [Tenacibaculum ovolyticum]